MNGGCILQEKAALQSRSEIKHENILNEQLVIVRLQPQEYFKAGVSGVSLSPEAFQ